MQFKSPLFIALAALAAACGTGEARAQYAGELGKFAPEALKGGEKPQPAQVKEIAPGLYFFWNDGSSNAMFMEQYSHYRNYHRMRGWVYALHHLLTTGKPLAAFP